MARRGLMPLLSGALALCALLLVSPRAFAFDPAADVKLDVSRGALHLVFPKGTHLKQRFLLVSLKPGSAGRLELGTISPADARDELDEPVWRCPVTVPLRGDGLSGTVGIAVRYQACLEGEGGTCFPPTTRSLDVKASEIPAAAKLKPAPSVSTEAPAVGSEERPVMAQAPSRAPAAVPPPPPARGSLAWLLLVAFGAGLAASLTPCVYPMIPITMAVIGAKGGGRAKGFALSLALVLGMAATYTVLGVVAAKTGAAFGAFAQRPAFLIPVSVLFALFALSLFGAFEIALPPSIQNRLQGKGPRRGYGGAFVMGLVLGPLAAPCVGPVVGSVLVGIAQRGDVALGALQLFVFSLGMGVLFMAAGTFSASLPRSGDWLTRLKHGMGLVVLGFAAWNVRLLAPAWANHLMWSAVALVGAAVFGAFEGAESLGGQLRRGCAILMLVLGVLLGIKAVEGGLGLELLPRGAAAPGRKPREAHGWSRIWKRPAAGRRRRGSPCWWTSMRSGAPSARNWTKRHGPIRG